MTARQRIQKRIKDAEAAIDLIRIGIAEQVNTPFVDLNQAGTVARNVAAMALSIQMRMAERRQLVNVQTMLEYHLSKHPGATETFGI